MKVKVNKLTEKRERSVNYPSKQRVEGKSDSNFIFVQLS